MNTININKMTTIAAFSDKTAKPVLERCSTGIISDVEYVIFSFIQHKNEEYDVFKMNGLERPTYVICHWLSTGYDITIVQIDKQTIIVGNADKWLDDTQSDINKFVSSIMIGE